MAVDFRVSRNPDCVAWFEEKLLALEERDVINATRERNPPHYHVAVYPQPYHAYAAANPLPQAPVVTAVDGGDAARSIIPAVAGLAAAALLAGTAAVIWRRERQRAE